MPELRIVGVAHASPLHRLNVLDTPAEERFDDIVRSAAYMAGTPVALISLLDETRQWFKAKVGVDIAETPREYAFCDHAVRDDALMWVSDAEADPRFRDNPLVTGDMGVRFYCGAPIRLSCGTPVGTVCVIGRVARPYDARTAERLGELADHAAAELEGRPSPEGVRRTVKALSASYLSLGDLYATLDPATGSLAAGSLQPAEAGLLAGERDVLMSLCEKTNRA